MAANTGEACGLGVGGQKALVTSEMVSIADELPG